MKPGPYSSSSRLFPALEIRGDVEVVRLGKVPLMRALSIGSGLGSRVQEPQLELTLEVAMAPEVSSVFLSHCRVQTSGWDE